MTDDPLSRYVARWLLPVMGIEGRSFTTEPPGTEGTRSSVRVVRIDGMPPLLLRAWDQRRRAVKNAEALRHLDTLMLAAPRLVAHDLTAKPGRLWKAGSGDPFITVETWIDGTPHADLAGEAAGEAALQVARVLARWHAVTRLRWGRPSGQHFRSFASYTLLGVRRMTRGLATDGWIEEAESRRVERGFSAWQERLDSLESFSLVHNDANRRNFIVTPAGETIPVDLHRLSYEPFPEEVVNAVYHFCRKDDTLRGRFLETYFEHAGAASRAAWDSLRGFFEPLNYLKKMYRRAGALARPCADARMEGWRATVLGIGRPA
jgi:Ser/Thr protein kinase RdoA (MazF antagonist)